jgi:hypothetical protein
MGIEAKESKAKKNIETKKDQRLKKIETKRIRG